MKMLFNIRLLAGVVACLQFIGISHAARLNAATKPNVVFVLIDDMGYADLSCYGGQAGLTPHIDSLAKEGIRFTQFYVGAPICSPSRTAFMTGQAPGRWRITSFLAARAENERRGMAQWLDPSAPFLSRVLQEGGYATGHFGKWHLGGQRDVGEAPLITEYGFDESVSNFEGLGDRILPLLDSFDGTAAKKYSLGSENLGRGKIDWMDRSKNTQGFVKRAMDFIQKVEKTTKPFYINLWLDDVHSPFFPPKSLRGDHSKRELYLGVIKTMDEQLSVFFDYVRNSPSLRTNTLIIVASDNGPEPGAGLAGPFRGTKGMLYEGGIRDPLIVWGPGLLDKSARGVVNESTIVSALDFFPSITRLAGVSLPKNLVFEGEDLSSALLGKSKKNRSQPLFWSRPPDRPGENGDKWPDLAMRAKDWKLLLMRDGSNPQLYDLAKDPSETRNLAADNAKVVNQMSQELLSWWESFPKTDLARAKRPNE